MGAPAEERPRGEYHGRARHARTFSSFQKAMFRPRSASAYWTRGSMTAPSYTVQAGPPKLGAPVVAEGTRKAVATKPREASKSGRPAQRGPPVEVPPVPVFGKPAPLLLPKVRFSCCGPDTPSTHACTCLVRDRNDVPLSIEKLERDGRAFDATACFLLRRVSDVSVADELTNAGRRECFIKLLGATRCSVYEGTTASGSCRSQVCCLRTGRRQRPR